MDIKRTLAGMAATMVATGALAAGAAGAVTTGVVHDLINQAGVVHDLIQSGDARSNSAVVHDL